VDDFKIGDYGKYTSSGASLDSTMQDLNTIRYFKVIDVGEFPKDSEKAFADIKKALLIVHDTAYMKGCFVGIRSCPFPRCYTGFGLLCNKDPRCICMSPFAWNAVKISKLEGVFKVME